MYQIGSHKNNASKTNIHYLYTNLKEMVFHCTYILFVLLNSLFIIDFILLLNLNLDNVNLNLVFGCGILLLLCICIELANKKEGFGLSMHFVGQLAF